MVKTHTLFVAFSILFTLTMFVGAATAQTRLYHLGQEWVKIWINPNGTIDLFYNVSITLDSGANINYVLIGQPNGDFTNGTATDQNGHALSTSDASSGSDYKVRVNLHSPLTAGKTIWFTLITNVGHMIYEDTQNPGNIGMQFIPTWWSEASVQDLRVLVVLPESVTVDQVKTSVNWNKTSYEQGRLEVFWEKKNLSPDEKYQVGASFPKVSGQSYETRPTGIAAFLLNYWPVFLLFGILVVAIVAAIVLVRKRPYLMPTIGMESLGIRRGLTAVEASYLLETKPTRIVTEVLYGLLKKRAVWVESTNPALRLKILQPFQDKKGTVETPLRYYEIDFLDALKEDGSLDEERLAQTVMYLRDTVEEKMRGYRRLDTIDYYKKTVAKAWEQVEQAGTPELASKTYDEQLLWLFLDPNYQSRTQIAFRDRVFEPSPLWLWYWFGYQHYGSNPTYKPNVEMPGQAAKPPSIPGAEFANNIATAVENASNSIVVNLEKFANSILPTPAAKSSSNPAHHNADCVCACAACACACACVSCACACAGGGVG